MLFPAALVPAFHAVAVTIAARWTSHVLGTLSPRSAKLEPTGKPTFDPDDRTIPVVFGTRWVQPVNLWYGDLAMRHEGTIADTRTRGYAWLMGWHQGLAYRPVDAIVKIRLADSRPTLEQPTAGLIWDAAMFDTYTAPPASPAVGNRYLIGTPATGGWVGHDGEGAYWNGSNWVYDTAAEYYHVITDNETVWLLNNQLIGGGYAHGGSGLGGDLDVMFGASDQTENTYLQTQLGTDIPAFRGIVSSVFWNSVSGHGGMVIQNTDDVPAWEYYLRRQSTGAAIGTYDMAGSAIVSEALTNADWGLGRPAAELDTDSFAAALATLIAEGLGMSLVWDGTQPVQQLLDLVMRHIVGVLYVEPATDLFVLKLIRDDYVLATLPVLDETNVAAVESYSRPAVSECPNALIASYTNRSGDTETITLHDTAAIIAAGGRINARQLEYEAFCDATVVEDAASRDLRNISRPLASIVLIGNRDLATLRPGDAFKFTWPKFGISEEVFRVTEINWGTMTDGEVRVAAMQDAFGLGVPVSAVHPASSATATYPVVISRRNDPPAAPADGDAYLIDTAPTGAWVGHAGEIATWDADTSTWVYTAPQAGGLVYVEDEKAPYRYNEDDEWEAYVGGLVAVDHDGTWEDPVPVWTGSIWRHASGGLRYKDDVAPTSDDDGVEFGFGGVI